MPDLTYDVIAVSFPIVYTIDGDHDRDGLLYALRVYQPLLDWARARWEDDDEALHHLHDRRQHIQLVVDGLWRYEQQLARLRQGPQADRYLIHDLGGPGHRAARPETGWTRHTAVDQNCTAPRACTPREAAVRQNFWATVDEVVAALSDLTDGAVQQVDPDPAVRAQWSANWSAALADVDAEIELRLAAIDEHPGGTNPNPRDLAGARRFDAQALADASGLSVGRVRRLLLNDHRDEVRGMAEHTPPYDRFNPLRPIPLIRPLVLRATVGQRVQVELENQIRDRRVGLHLQGEGLGGTFPDGPGGPGVRFGDGAAVGGNDPTVLAHGRRHRFEWEARHEGVWPINDLGDVRGSQQGSNVHGLFAAFVVEPAGAIWKDPETGETLTGTDHADGPYVDVIMPAEPAIDGEYVDLYQHGAPPSHREFTVFIHDEPEIHSGHHVGDAEHTVMPLSYRAEPMPNRLPHRMRRYAAQTSAEPAEDQQGVDQHAVQIRIDDELGEQFWVARTPQGEFLERVAGEEQHHSSWLFGDPVTPIFRAYQGDPARIRLVHAGVKETHVFHLHVHQWRAVAQDGAAPSVWRPGEHRGSQLIDSITIGPQTAYTIDPLYGSGSRQHAPGDVIWHCHLYPHFHHGMWGLWRSFDRLVDGSLAYPDGTPSHPLQPLPGRPVDPPTLERPGFPWFIDARFPQKSPPPPAVIPEHVVGRRRLLRMPAHSTTEFAAFAPGAVARPRTGMLFVDLDGEAVRWNAAAGLPPPRVIRYEVEVNEAPVEYNQQGWHDRHGHHYRLTAVQVSQLDAAGDIASTESFPVPHHGIEPFFPRANHGDILELLLHNELGTIPADHFDLTTPPVECGLHVHLVKFDVLAADGSSTGFNYLAGASCREAVEAAPSGALPANVGLHRWVVDEEFGPCFFHDHLLANYRQKHGLFAALIAEPHGSQWTRPDQQEVAWSGPEAVVVTPAVVPPAFEAFREACLAVGDFIPLYARDGTALNPPGVLGGDDDPGAMGVNYRCTPLTFRGDDPAHWFSAGAGDPDTPVIRAYAGERVRIRLIQGSHEEQHSFQTHGLRWRREWQNPKSPLVDQQTIGISEAFTLDLDPATGCGFGPGDHLWKFGALDDVWLGCWGWLRALTPGAREQEGLPLLPSTLPDWQQVEQLSRARPVPPRPVRRPTEGPGGPGCPGGAWSEPVREFIVVARRIEHEYDGRNLTDPWGLIYQIADRAEPVPDQPGSPPGRLRGVGLRPRGQRSPEPLVLRARAGEWVRVTLINEIDLETDDPLQAPFGPEPNPPRVPLESLDELGYPDRRTVSSRVSLHAGLVRYDVTSDDGAHVGRNQDGTVAAAAGSGAGHGHGGAVVDTAGHLGHGGPQVNWREYWWYADPALAPDHADDGPGQVCYLRDVADIRNHRHHGLIGALVVEPKDVTPVDPRTLRERWWGAHALILRGVRRHGQGPASLSDVVADERVLILQDGLRQFVAGDADSPVRDTVVGDDPEDAGQKGINYRTAVVHPQVMLADSRPPTPIWQTRRGRQLWLRLVCAADKPRNHTFVVHGMAWPAAPWVVGGGPWAGAVAGLTAGTVRDLVMRAEHPGDHAYRSGVLRWAVGQGMWGIIRVE